MSKSDVLYVKGMNKNNSDSEGAVASDDMWDDKQLNSAYDKALKMANIEVAKRIAQSTNSKDFKEQEDPKSKAHKSKTSKPSKKKQWTAGMACRAVYEGDGIEYEAFVLRIINEKECVVRFLGYDNSEIVSIDSMKPSRGKEAQQQQVEVALLEKEVGASNVARSPDMEWESERATTPASVDRLSQKKNKTKKKKKEPQVLLNGFHLPEVPPMPDLSKLGNFGSMELPMPPPPLPFPISDRSDSEDQAISSMLLSWYMSGYYTGLYQGLKRAKHNRRHKE